MKKLQAKYYIRSKRRQLRRAKRYLRASGYRKALRLRKKRMAVVAVLPVRVLVPTHLKYYSPRKPRLEIESFFENTDLLLRSGKSVILDFGKVERLYPCGVLILMGWVDEWVAKYSERITAKYPKNDLAEQMLQHVNVLQKLGLSARRDIDHIDVKRWHYFHGRDADATPMEPFMLELQKLLGVEQQLGLGNCVTEAMINVGHHAYQCENGGSWWVFSTLTPTQVFIAIYDRGDSVPGTLLAKPQLKDYLSIGMWLHGRGDGHLITAALGGRTRTQLPYRGKGLPEMLEFTKSFPNSELGIFSRYGFFRYDNQERSGKLKTPVKGTLVIWTLNIPANENG